MTTPPPSSPLAQTGPSGAPPRPIRRRHPSRWIASGVLLLLLALFMQALVGNENLQWRIVGQDLFDAEIMPGLGRALLLAALAMVIGIAIGIVLAVMRLSDNPVLNWFSWAWIWFFRGVPPLVQLIFWYNL